MSQTESLSKFKKTNYIKHLFQPQCYETREQLQGKKKKKKPAKHITHGGKQYVLSNKWIREEIKNTWRQRK